MTPYMRFHPDLSRQVFLTLVGYWELDVVEVPQQYYDVCYPLPSPPSTRKPIGYCINMNHR